ncbi:hypothetical protein B0H21DRAFT_824979 [Amylocystis lapponica]|nr:hypothetical protein B0H21DRAFT_824979 [Amylocystis lapponica]
MSLRMYAIWAKDWRVLVGLAFLGLIPPVVNMYYFTTLIIVSPPPPFVRCMNYVELSNLTVDIVLLLRDGTIYFLTLLILFVITLVADIHWIPEWFTIQLLIDTLSSILISRFFLNLREVYLSGYGTDGSSILPSQISTVRFASVFAGNLGAPLQDDFEETAGEEEERAYISDDPLVVGLFDESESILDPRHAE